MGHGRQVHAEAPGNGGVRFARFHPGSDEARQVEWRQAVALLVLGHLCANNDGNLLQTCPLGRAQSLGAEVDAVAAIRIGGMNDDGLQDAVPADVVGECVELGVGELGARVVRVFLERRDRDNRGCPGVRSTTPAARDDALGSRLSSLPTFASGRND